MTDAAAPHSAPLTEVELIWLKDRAERWIRFGKPAGERVLDRRRRIMALAPGAVFALVDWVGGKYGTTLSRIWVLRALDAGETGDAVPYLSRPAEIYLALGTWTKVQATLSMIDAVEAARIRPEAVAPDHWRHVGHRVAVACEPSAYDRRRHRAFLARKALGLAP